MKKKPDPQNYIATAYPSGNLLRKRAEMLVGAGSAAPKNAIELRSMLETLHELRVHQVELELQNEELRRTQMQLAAAKQRYFDLYDQAPVGYFTINSRGLIRQANLTATRLLGVLRSDLLNKPFTRFIHSEDQDIFYLANKKLIISATPQSFELRLLRSDGEMFWGRLETNPAQEDEETSSMRVVLSDCTASKLAAQKLEESYQAFRNAIGTMLDGFWRMNQQGRILEVNPAYCKLSGYTREELLLMQVSELDALGNCQEFSVHFQQLLDSSHAQFETRHRRKDGTFWHVEVSMTVCTVSDDQYFVFLRDISARKQAEERIKLAASVFEHSREGIMITSAEGEIINVNLAFTRITGYSQDDVIGQTPRLLNSGVQPKEFYVEMWRSLREKGHWYGEIWNRRKNGEIYAELQTVSAIYDAQGKIAQYVSLFSDISGIKAHQCELEHIAHFDALTGLPNRILLADRLRHAIAQAQRRNQLIVVVYLDLDGFKLVNDRCGHEAGDRLLIALSSNMQQSLREGDTLARLGGDEFVAVLVDLESIEASRPTLNRLREAAALPVEIDGVNFQVSASLGVTFCPQDEEVDADQLLRQADQAMYQAKLTGKNRIHFFDVEHDRSVRGYHESLEAIKHALLNEQFVLHYQPKVNLLTGDVLGVEALIRWQHPLHGLLYPSAFLPVIENHALAVELGEWVITKALIQMRQWQDIGLYFQVSINLGARQLQQQNLFEVLCNLLAAQPEVKPSSLVFEILETSALEDVTHVSRLIQACREIGVLFALDDFGTGYSSLTYLKRLPVAQLKIDKSFIRDMLSDPSDLSILRGVVELACAFHLQVIAEGVETLEHGALLLKMGCKYAQGNGVALPMPADELPSWLENWRAGSGWNTLPLMTQE